MYRGVEQLVARRAHNPEAGGSSPPPATKTNGESWLSVCFCIGGGREPEVRTDARSESRGCLQTMPRKKEEKQIACNLISPPPATQKGETQCFSFFRIEGITHAPTLTGTPSNLEGEFTQAVKSQRTEGVLCQKKERVRSLLSKIISTTKKLIVRGDFKACEEGDSAAY